MKVAWRMLLAGAALALALPASAHHSFTMFDVQKQRTLTGTVKEFQWSNPHCWIQLMVVDERGQDAEWSVELGPPRAMFERGWKPGSVRPGDRVTVIVHPLKDGARGGSLISAVGPDGQRIGKTPPVAPRKP